jgi:uncharacterized protein YvpB
MMKKSILKQFMHIFLVTAVLIGLVGFTNTTSASATTATYTTTADLNIRTGPSTKTSILGMVKKGTMLTIISKYSSSWYKINYNKKTGYAFAEYVKENKPVSKPVSKPVVAPTYQYMATANLNIRSSPSVSSKTYGHFKKGTIIKTTSKPSNGWVKISYNGKTAYVSCTFLKSVTASSVMILNVPVVLQNPELPAGCEVTSLTMALQYKGVAIDKLTLAMKMPFTKTLDPNQGYVGSPYNGTGYTINPVKLQELAKVYRSNSADLTGSSITTIEKEVRAGNPVLVWYTIGYGNVIDLNNFKYQNGKKYWWPQPLHCIVVTGVSSTGFYINDPLNGNKNYMIDKDRFNQVYSGMGKRALVVR